MNKQYPHPVTGAFIINEENKVLLVKSPKWEQGKIWSVPGGHIEWGETIATAIEREVKEEVGLNVSFEKVFAVWDVINPKSFHQPVHFIFLECLCHLHGPSTPTIDNTEITEARWFLLQDVLSLPLETYTQKSLTILL